MTEKEKDIGPEADHNTNAGSSCSLKHRAVSPQILFEGLSIAEVGCQSIYQRVFSKAESVRSPVDSVDCQRQFSSNLRKEFSTD